MMEADDGGAGFPFFLLPSFSFCFECPSFTLSSLPVSSFLTSAEALLFVFTFRFPNPYGRASFLPASHSSLLISLSRYFQSFPQPSVILFSVSLAFSLFSRFLLSPLFLSVAVFLFFFSPQIFSRHQPFSLFSFFPFAGQALPPLFVFVFLLIPSTLAAASPSLLAF